MAMRATSLAVEGTDGPRLLNVPKDRRDVLHMSLPALTEHCERYVGASFGIRARPFLPARR